MWSLDIRHWLNDSLSGPAVPQLGYKVKWLGSVITYVSGVLAELPEGERPRCWRRPGRKPCPGRVRVDWDPETEDIYWRCPVCGDKGRLGGWQGTFWDLTSDGPVQ